MNSETTSPTLKISDFPYLHEDFLLKFGAIYMPDLGRAELRCCQSYYLHHRRAPKSAEELSFLNAIMAQNYRMPNAFLISEMKTDDNFLAATFADLMAKRAVVSPDYNMPCSLSEISEIAQKYLSSQKKTRATTDNLVFSCAPDHALALAAQKVYPTHLDGDEQSGFSGGCSPSYALLCHAPLADGDKVYAFLKSTDPTEEFEEKLVAFASLPAVIGRAKKLCHVTERGVLEAIMSLGMGAYADLPRLYGKETSPLRLIEKDTGLLLVAKEADASEMLMDALDMGLRPRLVGTLRKDGQILLRKNADILLHFSHRFLSSLAFSCAYSVVMNPMVATPFSLIGAEEKTETIDELPVFLVRAESDGTRLSSLFATLHAIAACVARGADVREIRVAHRASLALGDLSAETLGRQLALLLGFYRATVEFELNTLDSVLLRSENTTNFTVYATVREPSSPTPSRLVDVASQIYLLEPTYDACGNPDLEDMKKMLAYVRALKEDGKILSAKAVTGAVLPALEEMSQNRLVEYLQDAPYVAKAGSILIETRQTIQGLLLARTCEPQRPLEEAREENE